MNVLMLSCNAFPYPPDRGGAEIRAFHLLEYLRQQHSVTLVTQRYPAVTDAEVAVLQQRLDRLALFPVHRPSKDQGKLAALAGKAERFATALTQMTPPNVRERYSPEIQAWIDEFIAAGKCDVVICEHSVNEMYIRPEFKQQVRTVVDIHSSVYGWVKNHLEMGASDNSWRDRLYLPLLYRYEQRYCTKFAHLVVTTPEDQEQMRQISPNAEITVIPNGVDLEKYPCRSHDPGGHHLVFVGAMDSSHNIDAARFLALEVLPAVQRQYPQATLSLVGARPVEKVTELGNRPGVTVTGAVPSTVDYLHKATVCVVPLRVGLGIKNKTLEALAAGVPTVGSDRGLEGLLVDGARVPLRALRANRVAEYVTAITRLFEDATLRQQLSQNARAMLEAEYTWERVGRKYDRALGIAS